MRVRSPKVHHGYDESHSSPHSADRNAQLPTFALDSDASVFLPKNGALSHLGDPKEGTVYVETNGKEEVAKVGAWVSQAWTFLAQPFMWMNMLCRELDITFVGGVIIVYGLSQGIGFALNRVVVDYYWRDVQHKQPSTVQFYRGIMWIPWDVKPLYGLLTDILPFFGYHRRPYFVLAGLVTVSTYAVLVFGGNLHAATALTMFVAASTASAISDVTIDALVAFKTREKPELGTHIQSLCGTCISIGSLSGYLISGLAVHILGSQVWRKMQWLPSSGAVAYLGNLFGGHRNTYEYGFFLSGALGIMLVPGILLLFLGFTIFEPRLPRHLWHSGQVGKEMKQACSKMWATLKIDKVWQPSLWMYLSWASSADIGDGKFYWYNDATVGPGFSEEFVGVMYAMGAVGTLFGVAIYQRHLRHWTFRRLLFWAQLLVAFAGMLDLMLVTRVNRKLLIPDAVFAVADEGASSAMARIKWMPLLVLAARLCPPGIEGTFFALLMSIDNLGMLSSSWVGGVLLKLTGVRRANFQYLWLTILIRNCMRLLPLLFLFLVPNTDPDLPLLPPELLGPDNPTVVLGSESEDEEDSEAVQLAVLQPSNRGNQVAYL